jgi:hypothetical protein
MKLSRQERILIELLRYSVQEPLPDWALTIAYRDGAWDILVRGMLGGMRAVGPTFEAAVDAWCEAMPEAFPNPPA